MLKERRKWPRRRCEVLAWIEREDGLIPCRTSDVSEGGARLQGAFDDIGDRFALRLTENGGVSRLCALVWRSGDQIGVCFLRGPQSGTGAAIVEVD